MKEYRVHIQPQTPFETPLHSDTIFGHLCWALKYLDGDDALKVFLDKLGRDPSIFLLSSAFPNGYLPWPILMPMSLEERETFRQKCFLDKPVYQASEKEKALRRTIWISEKLLNDVKDSLSTLKLYEGMVEECNGKTFHTNAEEWHNTLNRLSGQVLEGNLFTREVTFYDRNLVLFIRESHFGRDGLYRLFEFIGKNGYGANASSGKGLFSCDVEERPMMSSGNPNAVMLLSHTIPSPADPQKGNYRVFTKFCKAGGSYAVRGKYFKRPTLIIEPGATFIGAPKSYYGRILNNVHSEYKEIVHYGVGLPVPVRIT